jgi:hypothetical protein
MPQTPPLRAQNLRRPRLAAAVSLKSGAFADRLPEPVRQQLLPWLGAREGMASVVVSLLLFATLIVETFPPLPALLTGATFGCALVALVARIWEAATRPRPPFARAEALASAGREIREDVNARFWTDRRGFLWSRRLWFAGTGCPARRLAPETYLQLRQRQAETATLVADSTEGRWWWWHDAFYFDSSGCEPDVVQTLLTMDEQRER